VRLVVMVVPSAIVPWLIPVMPTLAVAVIVTMTLVPFAVIGVLAERSHAAGDAGRKRARGGETRRKPSQRREHGMGTPRRARTSGQVFPHRSFPRGHRDGVRHRRGRGAATTILHARHAGGSDTRFVVTSRHPPSSGNQPARPRRYRDRSRD